jgi:RIO kinase 1
LPKFPGIDTEEKGWDPENNPVGTLVINHEICRAELLNVIKGGKEAVVYCCEVRSRSGTRLMAAKAYRTQSFLHGFRNDNLYQDGRWTDKTRPERAFVKKTGFGRALQFATWIGTEYGALQMLHAAGADVPKPEGMSGSILLMEYFGDREQAAPMLRKMRLPRSEAETVFTRVMRNVELLLSNHLIHADLSPYNILYWQGEIRIIDLPQAVDARINPHAFELLTRDVNNVARYFIRCGVTADPTALTLDLWDKYQRARL